MTSASKENRTIAYGMIFVALEGWRHQYAMAPPPGESFLTLTRRCLQV